jgi:hypothetical protein
MAHVEKLSIALTPEMAADRVLDDIEERFYALADNPLSDVCGLILLRSFAILRWVSI